MDLDGETRDFLVTLVFIVLKFVEEFVRGID